MYLLTQKQLSCVTGGNSVGDPGVTADQAVATVGGAAVVGSTLGAAVSEVAGYVGATRGGHIGTAVAVGFFAGYYDAIAMGSGSLGSAVGKGLYDIFQFVSK